jgi:hypothetical protein
MKLQQLLVPQFFAQKVKENTKKFRKIQDSFERNPTLPELKRF